MPLIEEIPVESSNIATVGYDKKHKILQVRFKNDKVYHYFPVSYERHLEMLASESKGKFLNKYIKGDDDIDYKEVSHEKIK